MSKLGKYLIGILVAAAVVFLVWRFGNIVVYIVASAVLAIMGKPLTDAVQRVRIGKCTPPRWLAALMTLIVMWAVLVAFFTFFIPLVFGKLSELAGLDTGYIIDSFREPLQSLQDWLAATFSISDPGFSLTDQLSDFSLEEEANRLLVGRLDSEHITSTVTSTLNIVGSVGIGIFSITFITFFFLKEDGLFQHMVVSLFPRRYEENIVRAINSATHLLMRYFTGIAAESTIMFILLSGVFLLWGFNAQTAFFMGFIVGVLNVIPYVGPIISGCICIIVGVLSPLAGYTAFEMALVVLCMILLIQGVDNFVLQPYLYSKRVKSHPLEIFIVILVAGSLGGILGMLLAIPAYTVIRVFAKEFLNNYRIVQELTRKMDG